jgi:hypothetical protein
MITNWIVRGVDANAHDVWQVGVQANGPLAALQLAVVMMRNAYCIGDARINGDNYEPADPLPPPFSSIVGWRVKPVTLLP